MNTRELKILQPIKPLKNKLPGGISQQRRHFLDAFAMLPHNHIQKHITQKYRNKHCQRKSMENGARYSALDQVLLGCTWWVARAVSKEGGLLTCPRVFWPLLVTWWQSLKVADLCNLVPSLILTNTYSSSVYHTWAWSDYLKCLSSWCKADLTKVC